MNLDNIFQTNSQANPIPNLLFPIGNLESDTRIAEFEGGYNSSKKKPQSIEERLTKARVDCHQEARRGISNYKELVEMIERVAGNAQGQIIRLTSQNERMNSKMTFLENEVIELKTSLRVAESSIYQLRTEIGVLKKSYSSRVIRPESPKQERTNLWNRSRQVSEGPKYPKIPVNTLASTHYVEPEMRPRSVSWASNRSNYNQDRKFQREIPKDGCSFSAAMDLLERGTFAKYAGIQPGRIPYINQLVKGNRLKKNYEGLMSMLITPQYSSYLRPGKEQDCWKVVNLIQNLIIQNSNNKQNITHLPVVACEYCESMKKSSRLLQGNLNYIYCQNQFSIQTMNCSSCNKETYPRVIFWPDEFLMKISGISSSSINEFKRPDYPKFEQYWVPCIIQYNSNSKHFRTLKFSGNNSVTTIDGNNYATEEGLSWKDKKEIIYEKGWVPYIILYRRRDFKGRMYFGDTEKLAPEFQQDECIGGRVEEPKQQTKQLIKKEE